MSEQKQKFLSTLIVSMGAFLGFEALSFVVGIYQIKTYLQLSIYIYLFHVFWLTFIFDLHFKKISMVGAFLSGKLKGSLFVSALKDRLSHILDWNYLRHYQNYFILPGILYWSVVVLLFLNPFKPYFKQFLILASSLAMTVAYWYFKDFFSRKMETHELGLKILSLVKIWTAFLVFSSVVGVTRYYALGHEFLLLATFAVTFLLAYQAFFQHKFLNLIIYSWIFVLCVIMGLVAYFVYYYWDNYLTAGLVMLAVYNTCWALLHHHLEHTLSKKLAFEYVLVMIVALSLLFASHDFGSRIQAL